MVDGIKEYKDEDTKLLDFLVVKKNQSNHYNYLESDGKSSISLIQNEKSMFLRNLILGTELKESQVFSADDVKDVVTDYMKKCLKSILSTQKMMLRKL